MPDTDTRSTDNWSGPQVGALCGAIALITLAWVGAGITAAYLNAWPGFAVAFAATCTLVVAAVVVQRQVMRRLDRNSRQVTELRQVTAALGTDTLSRLGAVAEILRAQEDASEANGRSADGTALSDIIEIQGRLAAGPPSSVRAGRTPRIS